MRQIIPVVTILLLLSACTDNTAPPAAEPPPVAETSAPAAPGAPATTTTTIPVNQERNAYFGDLHVHTQLSFDAFIFGTRSTPDSAYEYAKGATLAHPAGFDMHLKKPLDFLGVTDHAVYMGMLPEMNRPDTKAGQHPTAIALREAKTAAERSRAFQVIGSVLFQPADEDDLLDPNVVRTAWQDTMAAAERHNDPGNFTAFIAYEYTTFSPAQGNLHRNVVFRDAGPSLPFSLADSRNPEDLWDWMDAQRENGLEALAIPHNSNGSDGAMFALTQTDGSAIDSAYADQRMRNEPLVEVTQVKGTSEVHPLLSPNDEWADFELMQSKVGVPGPSKPPGSYVREAYLNGLAMEASQGFNPYRFGLIGSSDTHVGAGSFDESNYWSKVGMVDATPVLRGSVPLPEPDADGNRYAGGGWTDWGASGLAGVWAESNTRDALYDALRRKETFATSGPRIRLRFFAGYDLPASIVDDSQRITRLYDSAVSMGGDLIRDADKQPGFFVSAARDPDSAPLQRLQVIKGWYENGERAEQVFDVACSDGLSVDPTTHRCPDNGAQVNLSDCSFTQNRGAGELSSLWQDPDFDPAQRAFYYVRALENPTCRWSTWDALRAGVPPRPTLHATIQERAWSSPIWFVP